MVIETLHWAIIALLGVILTFTCGWGYKVYYISLINKEKDFNNKIELKIKDKFQNYKKIIKEISDEKLVLQISNLARLKNYLKDGKNDFKKSLITTGLILLLCAFASILAKLIIIKQEDDPQTLIFIIGSITGIVHLNSFRKLRRSEDYISRFLEGETAEEILEEETT